MRSISIHTNNFQMLLLIKEKEKKKENQRKKGGLLSRRVHESSPPAQTMLTFNTCEGPSINQSTIYVQG